MIRIVTYCSAKQTLVRYRTWQTLRIATETECADKSSTDKPKKPLIWLISKNTEAFRLQHKSKQRHLFWERTRQNATRLVLQKRREDVSLKKDQKL